MKILPVLFILCCVVNSFSSPLVFKSITESSNDAQSELFSFDTSKYKQVRIGIKYFPSADLTDSAKRRIEAAQDLLNKGIISKTDFESRKNDIISNQRPLTAELFSIENFGEFYLANVSSGSVLVETPPTVISLRVTGKGKYIVAVWAAQ